MKSNLHFLLLGISFLAALPAAGQGSTGKFSFAIVADPQVSGPAVKNHVSVSAARTLKMACTEINQMNPDFTIFLGDLVNVFEPNSVNMFEECIEPLKTPLYLIHGNHEPRRPYKGFLELHKKYNDIDSIYYSFDHKGWHFVATPCDTRPTEAFFQWLDSDLKANRDKPTVIFQHFPMTPQGLSQIEFYGFDQDIRNRMMDALRKYGNVKYYFNGHVHNGIEASAKISKQVYGINFVTVPTVVHSRQYGEEYPEFLSGLFEGGYYMMVHVDGDKVRLEGRLAGNRASYAYAEPLEKFDLADEPLWLASVPEMKSASSWGVADFSDGAKSWSTKYRYQSDVNPAFVCKVVDNGGQPSMLLRTRSSYPESWANDEYTETYKIVNVDPKKPVILQAKYNVVGFDNGGGYLRVTLWGKEKKPYMFVFRWGENERNADYIPRCWGYEFRGKQSGWNFLREKAAAKEAFFVELDTAGTTLNVNLEEIFNSATGLKDGFSKLGIDRAYVGIGTWVNKELGSVSEALYDAVWLGQGNAPYSFPKTRINYSEIGNTEFGLALEMRQKARAQQANR